MTLLVVFFSALALFLALVVAVLLAAGYRPRKGSRYRNRFRGDGGTGLP